MNSDDSANPTDVVVRAWGYSTFAIYVGGEFVGTESTRQKAEQVGRQIAQERNTGEVTT